METNRLAAAVGLLLTVAACGGPTVHTDSFATMLEARQRGAVTQGWVPSDLPDGAYELRAAYEPKGPRRWGLFNFRPDAADALRGILQAEEVSVEGTQIDIPGRIEWWPIALRNALDPTTISATGLRTYRARSGALTFGVNWKQGRAYYWTPASPK